MLPHEFGPRKDRMVWCKFCEQWVVNNEKNVKHHEGTIDHKVNVAKFQQRMRKERIQADQKKAELDYQMATIQSQAQTTYVKKDIMKQKDDTQLKEFVQQQEQIDLAKELYGEELVSEMLEAAPKKVDKVDIYNTIMKSLPTRVEKRHRVQIRDFKD